MMAKMALEMPLQYRHLTRLLTRDDSIEFSHRGSSGTRDYEVF